MRMRSIKPTALIASCIAHAPRPPDAERSVEKLTSARGVTSLAYLIVRNTSQNKATFPCSEILMHLLNNTCDVYVAVQALCYQREQQDDTIHTRRACILKSLCVYLNEDHEKLVKEYTNTEANTEAMEQTVMGVYVIHQEGAEPGDDPENIGVLIEGVEVLTGLRSIAIACALLFGLIYCLNLSYPPELKCTFEVLQKIIMKLDGQRLSSKAQFLKNKLMG
ncbi:uncharacterized protein LOC143418284 [Maylandia zebra]|uniref:uncharacterized protein LOC143418284 n=1 Tax=Maylandia zebra TaxID=106582 RepID=UPI00403C5D91